MALSKQELKKLKRKCLCINEELTLLEANFEDIGNVGDDVYEAVEDHLEMASRNKAKIEKLVDELYESLEKHYRQVP